MNNAEFNRLKRLAKIVIPTIEKNKKQRIEKERRGDFFNIFSILKVERNEVYTHSAMLCELLNPKGSHGMSDKFLLKKSTFVQFKNTLNLSSCTSNC